MDYIAEAKKFIQRAVDAHSPEVVKEHLKMADWCLGQEIGLVSLRHFSLAAFGIARAWAKPAMKRHSEAIRWRHGRAARRLRSIIPSG